MTNKEYREKYPIGTRIRYGINPNYASKDAKKDIGKRGKIVGYTSLHWPIVFLPESTHISCSSTSRMKASWSASWESIEILPPRKNEQLVFSFMED